MAETTTQDVGLVERILEKRVDMDTGAVEYLIRWQGTDSQGSGYEDTWEPEENVLGVELIEEFEQSQPTMRVHPRQPTSAKPNGTMLHQGENNKHRPSVQYPHPSLPPRTGPNRHQRPHGREHHPDPHLAQSYPPHWQHDGPLRRTSHQSAPFGASPGYYPPRYAPQYPPMHRQPLFPGQFPMQHYPIHPPYDHTRAGEYLPKRDRSSANFTNSSKRKASASMVEDPESKDMSGVESTAEAELTGTQETGETDKRLKAENMLRSYNQSRRYISRRQTTGINGKSTTIIRLLQLDHDRERAYFKSVLEKSELLKDVTLRLELLQFLKDPRNPGFDAEAGLLKSDTWLVELKEQQEASGSLFLALDIPGAVIKALFIPETLLGYQRQQHPGKGLVLNDRSIVSAIIAGDLRGSGLSPAINNESGSTIPPPKQPNLAESAVEQADTNGDVSMEIDEPTNAALEISCGWRGCNEMRTTVQELSLHVQQDHLQNLESGAGATYAKPVQNGSEASQEKRSHESDGINVTEVSRDDQIVHLQSSYSSLKNDLARMKEEIMRSDQQAQELSKLYSAAIESSEETIKRLEAQLEWEMKKWDQYREETRRMIALGGGNEGPVQEQQLVVAPNDDAASTLTETPDGQDSGLRLPGGHGFDKPMEAQSQNTIQTIQKLLIIAREKQARLEQQNLELVSKRKALDSEYALLDQRYRETLAQLTSLEAKDHNTAEALRNCAKGVEQCRTTIGQEQEQSRKTVRELQSKIDELRQGTSSPQPQLSPPAAMDTFAGNSMQESDANGDHIMTGSTPPPRSTPQPSATPVSTLLPQVELSDGLSPMSVDPEPSTATDSKSEPSILAPSDEPQQPVEPVKSSSSSDQTSTESPAALSIEQPVENSDVQMTQEQQEQQEQLEQPISSAPVTKPVNLDTSSHPSTSADTNTTANTAPAASFPTPTDSVPAPAPTPGEADATTTHAVKNGPSTSTSTSPLSTDHSSAPQEKIRELDENLPSEEPSAPSPKAPMAASDNGNSINNDTPTTVGPSNSNSDSDINCSSTSVYHLTNKDN
ncbi:hypothetical protein BG015_011842 [Linnemannia schmuckeri]|uniref:Chromo domain-containing protein n=1 Tax=Linnemannia schmuckeri TaxID=64567 RepID=A0A9P5RS04_9FUNG|nr:hypothetical protein BG015_011842 [Linnemannia schmuckeri]